MSVKGWRQELSNNGKSSAGLPKTYIFIASNCSFLGMISSMKGVNKGYVVVICVLMARCTEDLTLDLDPGDILELTVSVKGLLE